jgi:hypothetical protein
MQAPRWRRCLVVTDEAQVGGHVGADGVGDGAVEDRRDTAVADAWGAVPACGPVAGLAAGLPAGDLSAATMGARRRRLVAAD